MYTKIIYVIVDCLAIIDLLLTIRAMRGIKKNTGHGCVIPCTLQYLQSLPTS